MVSRRRNGLRIAMLSYHTCPLATLGGKDTGGMNVYVRELTRQLGRAGVHVDVFTRSQDEHVPHVLHDLGYGNRVVHVPSGPEVPLPKRELVDHLPEFVSGIQEFAANKGLQYDLIHSHYWLSGIAAKDLKAAWGVPVVQMFHTLGLMKQRVARDPGEMEGEYRIQGEQEVLRIADRIVAATPAELAQLQWLYRADTSKVEIVPPGVDISHFYPIPQDEAKEFIGLQPCDQLLLFVGRIEPLKGIDNLIEAIAILRRQGLIVCLSVIGGDPDQVVVSHDGAETKRSVEVNMSEMKRLQDLRARYGMEDLVAFLGRRSQDTLPYYYSAAEAVVVPSHYESFGMVALEAMACGTPVVASQVGGLAYLVQDGETGYTVPADDPQALADALNRLLMDPDMRRRMGRQAAEFAKEYAWSKIAARIVKIYDQALLQTTP
jgi:D-inositol-3-phosphate glycosyltransferase